MSRSGRLSGLRRAAAPSAVVLCLAVASLATAAPAQAATALFVRSTNCSDTGSGTSTLPFCTISRAAAVAVAGQTVRVAAGTYPETVTPQNSGLPGAPIVYRPDQTGAKVVVTGGTNGFALVGVSWITITGFTVTGTTGNGIFLNGAGHVEISGNRVERSGLRVEGLNEAGIYVKDTVDSTIAGNITVDNSSSGIYLTAGTTRVTVSGNESTGNAFGWQRNANGIDVRASGNAILGNITHHNEDSGIQLYPGANDNLVANNLSYSNRGFTTTQLANCEHPPTGNTAGCFTGDHGIDNLKVTGNRVIGNTVFGNTTAGINLEGLDGVPTGTVISNNISMDNAVDCPDGAGGTTTCPATKGNIRIDATSGNGTVAERDVVWTSTGGPVMAWGNIAYRTLEEVRAVSGGQESTGRQADPQFVSPGTGDFRLRGGSPAIDMADSAVSGQQSTDIQGRPRVDAVATPDTGTGPRPFDDAGAYEYPPVPGTPSATATAGIRSVALTWTVPPAGGSALKKFLIYRGTSPTTLTKKATLSSSTTSWTDSKVTAWQTYYYEVSATNSAGESLHSPTAKAIPTGAAIVPAAPVATATTAPQQVNLSWTAPAENGSAITQYVVYRGTSPSPTTPLVTLGPTTTSYADAGLTNKSTYYYRVRARNSVGLSAYSADVAAMPTSIISVGTEVKPLTSGVTSASMPLPAQTAAGDVLVAWLGFTNNASAIAGLDGWTPLPGSPWVDGSLHTAAAYYKVAGVAEPVPTVTWTTTSKGVFAVAAYRGVDVANPVAAAGGLPCDVLGATTVSTPALATSQSGTWAVALFASRSSTASAKNISWEPGPGLTERADANNGAALSSPWVGVEIADTAGAVSVGTHSYQAAPSYIEIHHHSALVYLNSVGGAP